MFYYPTLLESKNLVNLQVVIPGGWGTLNVDDSGLHFLWENLYFSPTPSIPDPDEWLWENTLDFWSVTSYESIRLNFTLLPEQMEAFIPTLKTLLQPRLVDPQFLAKEIKDLQFYWQTDRDQKEDAVLRDLFKTEHVVHPNKDLINHLQAGDVDAIYKLWEDAEPYVIILGAVHTDDLISLGQLFPQKSEFKAVHTYHPPNSATNSFTKTRWGLKVNLNESHLYELLVIELWEQQFKVKFFFEYHLENLFIWTNDQEHPHLLLKKVKAYALNETDFNNALNAYLKFLTLLYQGDNSKSLEKLSELTEGLHAHPFQRPTYKVSANDLDLSKTMTQVNFQDFKDFYQNFVSVIPTQ